MLVSCRGYWDKAPGGKMLLIVLKLHRSYTWQLFYQSLIRDRSYRVSTRVTQKAN